MSFRSQPKTVSDRNESASTNEYTVKWEWVLSSSGRRVGWGWSWNWYLERFTAPDFRLPTAVRAGKLERMHFSPCQGVPTTQHSSWAPGVPMASWPLLCSRRNPRIIPERAKTLRWDAAASPMGMWQLVNATATKMSEDRLPYTRHGVQCLLSINSFNLPKKPEIDTIILLLIFQKRKWAQRLRSWDEGRLGGSVT